MTPKIIELKQAPVVLVELLKEDISYYNIDKYVRKGLEADGYVFKGFLSDLTEEQFVECVDKIGSRYRNYMYQGDGSMNLETYKRPSPAMMSLLESEKVYTENPYGERPDCGCYTEYDREGCADECYRWINAQNRTIDPKRTIVLLKKEETK